VALPSNLPFVETKKSAAEMSNIASLLLTKNFILKTYSSLQWYRMLVHEGCQTWICVVRETSSCSYSSALGSCL